MGIQGNWFWYGTKRKRICDFLFSVIVTLVLSCTISEILQVFWCSWVNPPLFQPKFGGVPVAPDRPYWGQPSSKLYRAYTRGDRRRDRRRNRSEQSSRRSVASCIHRRPVGATIAATVAATIAPCIRPIKLFGREIIFEQFQPM